MFSIQHGRWLTPLATAQVHALPVFISMFGETTTLNLPRQSERTNLDIFHMVGNDTFLQQAGLALSWFHMFNGHAAHVHAANSDPLMQQLLAAFSSPDPAPKRPKF